jgi:hypothetical protein
MSEVSFSRVHVEFIIQGQATGIVDYAVGEYLATKQFFQQISDLQAQIISGEEVVLATGQVVDPQTTGGLMAIQLYMETVDSAKQAMSGLAKLGLSIERQSWKALSS